MIKFMISAFSLVLLCMNMSDACFSVRIASFCNIICEDYAGRQLFNLNSTCEPTALHYGKSDIDKSIYDLCSSKPIYNFDSQAVKVVLGFNNCTPWSSRRFSRINPQSKCQLRLDEMVVP